MSNRTFGHEPNCPCELCSLPAEHTPCECVVKNRKEGEQQRDWLKRWMCMYHWMQTDYYQAKLVTEPDGTTRLVEPRTAAGSLD
jgi:hypothetical protein